MTRDRAHTAPIALEAVLDAWARLIEWMHARGFAGYDPYDVRGSRLYVDGLGRLPASLRRRARRLLDRLARWAPRTARQLARIEPHVNANTMALVLRASLAVVELGARSPVGPLPAELVERCVAWLLAHPCEGGPDGSLGWGYPFTWMAGHGSAVRFDPSTPLSVVTAEAGHGFLDRYEQSQDDRDLARASACGRFVTDRLNRDERPDGTVCFSYSPRDHFHVNNANLASAAFLTRLAALTGDRDALDLARRARRYTVELQNGDGSWFYWGPPDLLSPAYYRIDTYHTGMVLQWLEVCLRHDEGAASEAEAEALERGLQFFLDHLIDADGAPKKSPVERFPVDVHAAAQTLVTLSHVASRFPEATGAMGKVLAFALEHLRNADGTFAYRVEARRVMRQRYMRWGQAWMAWGLACAARALAAIDDFGGTS